STRPIAGACRTSSHRSTGTCSAESPSGPTITGNGAPALRRRGTGPRLRLGLALGALVVLGVLASLAGARRSRRPDDDPRRSTFVYGPDGASGWAEALERMGIRVEQVRDPSRLFPDSTDRRGALVAVLDPGSPLDAFEGGELAAHAAEG